MELRWLPPAITGGQTHVYYDVDCRMPCDCDVDNECVDKECGNDVTYLPYKEDLHMAEVITINLSSFVNYTFKICAKNRVSEVAKRRHGVGGNFAVITVRTNESSKFLIFFFLENFQCAVKKMFISLANHLRTNASGKGLIFTICTIYCHIKGK